MLVDTHCHIHEADYPLPATEVLARAHAAGVDKMLCVGTSEQSSTGAVKFANEHTETYAVIGVHPHESKHGWSVIGDLLSQGSDKLVGIGEIGLDYYYGYSPRETQIEALEQQIEWALQYGLPISFHVRDAFDDFWPVFDNFHGIRGVLHSFTDSEINLEQVLRRGLYVGANGISTFTRDEAQKAVFASVPLERLLFETDAPFLTPLPFRGKINEPAFVRNVAEYWVDVKGISLDEIAAATTANAHKLFKL